MHGDDDKREKSAAGTTRALRHVALVAATAGSIFIATACGNTADQRTDSRVFTLAMTDKTPPALSAGNGGGVYEMQVPVAIPLIERPAQLPGTQVKPYPRVVWYTPSDLRVQVSYVLTNAGDQDLDVEILLDGWNEFIRYTPMVSVDEEGNVNADLSTLDRRVYIHGHERLTGTFSFDDMERVAYDLATIMNGAPNPFHVVESHTKLLDDLSTKPYVPSVIDGITGFDLSVRTMQPANLELEATLEMIDQGGFLVPDGTPSKAGPPSTRYRPVVASASAGP